MVQHSVSNCVVGFTHTGHVRHSIGGTIDMDTKFSPLIPFSYNMLFAVDKDVLEHPLAASRPYLFASRSRDQKSSPSQLIEQICWNLGTDMPFFLFGLFLPPPKIKTSAVSKLVICI